MIGINIEDRNGFRQPVEIPEDTRLSLMEYLKEAGYPFTATCGGIALCGDCHVEVLQGSEDLPEPQEDEMAMIESLPETAPASRLACQLRISPVMNGMSFRLMPQ
ncbi:2Fe-2S iron-sulfur cluster-binding protein [Mucilaginibacter sp.]|uniref:2Fe-2S iron-sulfur cluster-binding protein n=1 Tax=Mucilaginibacter sp. TaxID=1882438 RepID=UPI0035BBF95E